MLVTKADLARLGRRDEQPRREAGELLAIFVHGKVTNPLNGSQGRGATWRHIKARAAWRERVHQVLLEAGWRSVVRRDRAVGGFPALNSATWIAADCRKHVTIIAYTSQRMDGTEGLRAACKAIPDALRECGVVDDDSEAAGHVWEYRQVADPKRNGKRGVEIRVRLAS